MEDFDRYTDVLGQLPRLKTYTHILLCFPLEQNARLATVQALQIAVQRLTKTFPWLAHQVKVVHNPNTSGTFTLAPCPEFAPPNTILFVKDCTNSCPTYKKILAGRGPQSMFGGGVLAQPNIAFPQLYDESILRPAPVLALQANLIKGGLLLNAAAQHNFIDGGGLLRLLEYLARAMRGEAFSPFEIKHGNRDRRSIIRLLQPNEPLLDHGHLLRESLSNGDSSNRTIAIKPRIHDDDDDDDVVDWSFFRFKAASVSTLKQSANQNVRAANVDAFVSTNDTLSAFVWQRLSIVRALRHQVSDASMSKFSRAMDARRAINCPREYLGQMGFNTTCSLNFGQLKQLSLGEIALFMREAVQKTNNEYAVRSWATLIAREADKSRIMFGGKFNPALDVGLSSLVHASVHDVEFGCLGKPNLIRRPHFSPLESCVYFWTYSSMGDIDLLLCLKQGDREALRKDDQWSKHVEHIG